MTAGKKLTENKRRGIVALGAGGSSERWQSEGGATVVAVRGIFLKMVPSASANFESRRQF